jgi:hypothetical protein
VGTNRSVEGPGPIVVTSDPRCSDRNGQPMRREPMRRERQLARDMCTASLKEARGIVDQVQRASAELAAERGYRSEMKRIEKANRASRFQARTATGTERRAESDEELAGELAPEFLALWEPVKAVSDPRIG